VTTKPENSDFEAPAITICPYPAVKPSISEEFKYPAIENWNLSPD
jgi:hypothetical protein